MVAVMSRTMAWMVGWQGTIARSVGPEQAKFGLARRTVAVPRIEGRERGDREE